MKQVRLHITRTMCGKPLKHNKSRVSTDKEGFPSRFLYLKKMALSNDPVQLRKLLTILNITRAIEPHKSENKKIKPNFLSVVLPYSGHKTSKYLIPVSFMDDFISRYKLHLEIPKYSNNSHYISMKGGPGGKSSANALTTLNSLRPNHWKYIGRIVNSSFFKKLLETWRFWCPISANDICPVGQMSIVNDPEGKRRIIAMLDYHSQMILRPIHDGLFNLLKTLPCDRTFTQDPFFNSYCNKYSNTSCYHSLDLSSATDRFPVFVQERFLSRIYQSRHFSRAWSKLLTDRDFIYYPSKDKTFFESYRYAVGQPMGAYSSWPAFTITHHLCVHWAAYLCGLSDFHDYIILGDDIVIRNDQVAKRYRAIMRHYGVEISEAKTHVSKDTYEFAKRWIKGGCEISGIPLKGILANIRNKGVFLLSLWDYNERIPAFGHVSIHNIAARVYSGLAIGRRRSGIKTLKGQFFNVLEMLNFTFGRMSPSSLRSYLLSHCKEAEKIIPSEENIMSFFKEILSFTLECNIKEQLIKILPALSDFKTLLRENGNDNPFEDNPYHPTVKDPYSTLTHPHFWGLLNGLVATQRGLDEIIAEGGLMSEIPNNISIITVDKIARSQREKSEFIADITKVWNNSKRTIRMLSSLPLYGGRPARVTLNPFTKVVQSFNIFIWDTLYPNSKKVVPKSKEKNQWLGRAMENGKHAGKEAQWFLSAKSIVHSAYAVIKATKSWRGNFLYIKSVKGNLPNAELPLAIPRPVNCFKYIKTFDPKLIPLCRKEIKEVTKIDKLNTSYELRSAHIRKDLNIIIQKKKALKSKAMKVSSKKLP